MAWALYAVGWSLGWLLLWSNRPLPAPAAVDRPPLAVVVPARDEAAALPRLLDPLAPQLGPADELVVVDDHSSDDTAAVARTAGARVVAAPPLPDGWVGKPHACATGAAATTAATLVFLDADVRPGPVSSMVSPPPSPPRPTSWSRCSRGTTPSGRASG